MKENKLLFTAAIALFVFVVIGLIDVFCDTFISDILPIICILEAAIIFYVFFYR